MSTLDLAAPVPVPDFAADIASADVAAKAAHNAYLDAYGVAFHAIYEVAVGEKPSKYLYEVLSNLDRAVGAHATACWSQGAAATRAFYEVK